MMAIHHNTESWIKENKKSFLPPVCNKMMHNDQLKVFYVGGGNQRKDFHMEEGEELFYMRKGDMELPILVNGTFRNVRIREGEVFLLPGQIPHSPQRPQPDSVGLVVERERLETETDGLRYFVGDTTSVLWERWFYCDDLGTQLGPVIREYFASREHSTGQPVAGSGNVLDNPPWHPRADRIVEDPFPINHWLNKHRERVRSSGEVELFPRHKYQSDILVLGRGQGPRYYWSRVETFLIQLQGTAKVTLGGKNIDMNRDDSLLIPARQEYLYAGCEDSMTLSTCMDPHNKLRPHNNKEAFLNGKDWSS